MNNIVSIEVIRQFERAGISIKRQNESREYLTITALRTKRIEFIVNYVFQVIYGIPADFKFFKFGGTNLTIHLGTFYA